MSDHRDSILDDDGSDPQRLADDLLLDAILAGRAQDDDASVRRRVRAACERIADQPLASIGSSSPNPIRWRSLTAAAAVLVAAVGLVALLVATPSPAFALVDASIRRIESGDLTFRITVDTADERLTADRPPRPHRRGGGLRRQLDGATLHVRGEQSVMLIPDRSGAVLARGHDGTRFWSNHLPDDIEAAISARGERGLPLSRFLDAIDGDLPALLRRLRGGYRITDEGETIDPLDGSTVRHLSATRISETTRAPENSESEDASTPPVEQPRGHRGHHGGGRGHPDRIDLWIGSDGTLRRLQLDGPDGGPTSTLLLELVGTDRLEDAVFDPASYPEIPRLGPRREGGASKPPRGF